MDEFLLRFAPALRLWADHQMPAWIRSKVDPDDLVQQTLVEAIAHRERLQPLAEHEILAYLRRALTNNVIDAARKFTRNRDDVRPEAYASSSFQLAHWLAASDTSPSERVARHERYDRLRTALTRLPDAQRIAIEWRYLHQAKVAEIAKLLDRTDGAVMALLHRAMLTLREFMKMEDLL